MIDSFAIKAAIKTVGKPYRKYYRELMRHTATLDYKDAVGVSGQWDVIGPLQLERLKKYGLKPHHRLYDIGCGSLRGGRFFIDYLDKGNYYGGDISPEVIVGAHKVLEEYNLTDKAPHVSVVEKSDFRDVEGTFDYIHAQSVLSHMPKEDIRELFRDLKKVMRPDSIFLASFFQDDYYHPSNLRRNFHYPLSLMRELAEGFRVELVEDVADILKKQPLMLIRLCD